jgi:hypothetical protein
MKPRLIVPLLGAAALVFSASAAVAKDCRHGKRPSFEDLDADKNGALTADEFAAGATARANEKFQKLDLNQDGVVTQDELATAKEQWRQHRRERRKSSLPM